MGGDRNSNYILRNTKIIYVVFLRLLHDLIIKASLITRVSCFPWGLLGALGGWPSPGFTTS